MEKFVDLWNKTLWFKILSIIIIATLCYWFSTLAILAAMILIIYAIITIIRKYILNKPTRFKALYIFIIAIILTIIGSYGYAQNHPEEMVKTNIEQQKANTEQETKEKAQDDKNEMNAKNITKDKQKDTITNKDFVEYLNNDLSKLASNQIDNKTLLNSKTMKFESKNARTVFLIIPHDIKSLTNANKQKLANNAQYIYQENYKNWSQKNNITDKNPPMLIIKYTDSEVGDEMAVWIPNTTNIELR